MAARRKPKNQPSPGADRVIHVSMPAELHAQLVDSARAADRTNCAQARQLIALGLAFEAKAKAGAV